MEPNEWLSPDALAPPAARAVPSTAHGTPAARRVTPGGRPRGHGHGLGHRGASKGGSLSQPPLELPSMDGLEDEDVNVHRASKVNTHSFTNENVSFMDENVSFADENVSFADENVSFMD